MHNLLRDFFNRNGDNIEDSESDSSDSVSSGYSSEYSEDSDDTSTDSETDDDELVHPYELPERPQIEGGERIQEDHERLRGLRRLFQRIVERNELFVDDDIHALFEGFELGEIEPGEETWSKVTCPNFHDLTYKESSSNGWACDMAEFMNREERTGEDSYWREFSKTRYGLKESEGWNCLRGCQNYHDLSEYPVYSCRRCNFDLCDKCYERAKAGLEKMSRVYKLMNTSVKIPWMQSKLMVVGEGKAGKTSTVRTLLGMNFNSKWDSTIGASLTHVKTTNEEWVLNDEEKRIGYALKAATKLVSKEKEERNKENRREKKVRNNHRFDELEKTKIADEQEREKEFKKHKPIRDEHEEKQSSQNGESKAEQTLEDDTAKIAGKFTLDLLSNDGADDKTIKFTIWDYGGQSVFHTLHHLFLTEYGIYLVIFNAKKFLSKESKATEVLTFWLKSIRIHARGAPILLVGTHIDAFWYQKRKTQLLEKSLSKLVDGVEQVKLNNKSSLSFFPLSNTNKKGIQSIKEKIQSVSMEQEFLNLMVDIRWLRCLDLVQSENESPWLSLEDVTEIANGLNITSATEISRMLNLFHELGTIIHFNTTTELEKIVVVDPQWLIDEISKLIRDITIHAYDTKEIKTAGLFKDFNMLKQIGIASFDFLEYLWGRSKVQFFTDLLRGTMLLSDWNFGEGHDKLYLVPSLLQNKKYKQTRSNNEASCKFDFSEDFLPDGCFQRLVCLAIDYCLGHSSGSEPNIARNFAEIYLEDNQMIQLILLDAYIFLNVFPSSHGKKYLNVVESMLKKVNTDIMNGGLKWKMLYMDGNKTFVDEKTAKDSQLKPWFNQSKENKREEDNPLSLDLDAFIE